MSAEVCVICAASVRPEDSGLCDAHKYAEQLTAAEREAINEAIDLEAGGPEYGSRAATLATVQHIVAKRRAEALREFDTDEMAEALGGKSAWLTSASHVANIVRHWLDEAADEIEATA